MKSYENSKIPRLFQLMEEKNIKASHITRDLKISSGNISGWKTGAGLPTNAVLHALADYLDTTTDYLTGKTDIKEKPTESGAGVTSEESALLAAYRSKPQNVKNAVKALLEIEV